MSLSPDPDQEFPFTREEWERVSDASRGLVETTVNENDPRYTAALAQMRSTIAELRTKYGDHPVLLETLGDHEDDVSTRVNLYRAAVERAGVLKLTSYSVRLALAHILITECSQPGEALDQLSACTSEVAEHGDVLEREEHKTLVKLARGLRMRGIERPAAR